MWEVGSLAPAIEDGIQSGLLLEYRFSPLLKVYTFTAAKNHVCPVLERGWQ
jgi:hypothetical protein